MSAEGDYSRIADSQLDELETVSDVDLYKAVSDACELTFRLPVQAQSMSSSITTDECIRMRLPVAGHPPYKAFWSTDRPRIEAVFPHP